MANENRYYKTAFAESGNKTEIPDVSVDGAVGYDTGFGPDYELAQGNVNRKRIPRDNFNGLNNGITKNLKQWQENLYPTWIEDNGDGVPFSYSENMIVAHAGQNWRSTEAANQEEPGAGIKWAIFTGAAVSSGSIANLSDYIDISIDTVAALESACIDGRIVDFNGLSVDFDRNFTLPATSICNEWRLNGADINFLTGICVLDTSRDFKIDLGGGLFKLGLKKAKLTVNSVAGDNTFTVEDASDFSVGDDVSCSFSLDYLPNAGDRINNAPSYPLTEFNYITDITGNVITVNYNVPQVIPANAYLLNSRFDKGGLTYSGTGVLTVENGTMDLTSAGYFIAMTDSSRTSEMYLNSVKFPVSGLDQFLLNCKKAVVRDCFMGERLDIAKQCFVVNTAPDSEGGLLACYNSIFRGNNRDTLMYTTIPAYSSGGEIGSMYFENCTIDGVNTNTYSGSAEDFHQGDSLHLWSSGGSGMPAVGHVTINGGSIVGIERAVFGTTFATKDTWAFKSFTMNNVIPCEADPIYISLTDYANSSLGRSTLNNCEFTKCGRATLNTGYPLDDAGKVVYNNCELTPSDHLTDTDITLARSYLNNCKLNVGLNGEFWDVAGSSNQLNHVVLDPDGSTGTGALRFLPTVESESPYTLLLAGQDLEDDSFTLTDWFASQDSSAPEIRFSFIGCGVKFFYGDDPAGSSVKYTMQYLVSAIGERPKDFRGWFAAVTTTSSTVFSSTSQEVGKCENIYQTTGTGASAQNQVTLTSNPSGAVVVGSTLMAPNTATPNSMVYCYKVIAIDGLVVTLDRNLIVSVNGPVRGFTVRNLDA